MAESTSTAGKRVVDAGQFRLDRQRALEKLRHFQLPSPHHYILEFVKAAHLLEADRMQVKPGSDEVTVRFDGHLPTEPELQQLYSAAFSTRAGRRLEAVRHMELGINAARGSGFGRIVVAVGGAEKFALEVGDDEVRSVDESAPSQAVTEFRFSRRWHRSVLSRFRRLIDDETPEARLLKKHAVYSSVDIAFGSDRTGAGMHLPVPVRAPIEYEVEGELGLVGIDLDDGHFTTSTVQHGVLVETDTRQAPFFPVGGHAVVETSRLNTDLSQYALVEDEAHRWMRRRVDAAAYRSLAKWLRSQAFAESMQSLSGEELSEIRGLLRRGLRRLFADRDHRRGAEETFDELAEAYAGVPLFETAIDDGSPELIGIDDARFEEGGQTVIRYSTRSFDRVSRPKDEPLSLWFGSRQGAFRGESAAPGWSSALPELLEPFADRVVDVTDGLRALRRRDENRRRWENRPEWTGVSIGVASRGQVRSGNRRDRPRSVGLSMVENETFECGDIRAEVGTGFSSSSRFANAEHHSFETTVYYVKQGRLLNEETLESPIGPLRIVIRGELEPDLGFDRPASTQPLRRVQADVLEWIAEYVEHTKRFTPAVFRELLGSYQDAISRVFYWDWTRWPERIVDTPLGIAEPLLDPLVRSAPDPMRRLQMQLTRLGDLVDEPLVYFRGDEMLSLRQFMGVMASHYPSKFEDVDDRWLTAEIDHEIAVFSRAGLWKAMEPKWLRGLLQQLFGIDASSEQQTKEIGDQSEVVSWLEEKGLDQIQRDAMELSSKLADDTRQSRFFDNVPSWAEVSNRRRDDGAESGESETTESRCGEISKALEARPELDEEVDDGPSLHREPVDRLLDDLSRSNPLLADSIDAVRDVELIESDGDTAVYRLGGGDHLVLDRSHPAVGAVIECPSDPVARAMAVVALEEALMEAVRREQNDLQERGEDRLKSKRRMLLKLTSARHAPSTAGREDR